MLNKEINILNNYFELHVFVKIHLMNICAFVFTRMRLLRTRWWQQHRGDFRKPFAEANDNLDIIARQLFFIINLQNFKNTIQQYNIKYQRLILDFRCASK